MVFPWRNYSKDVLRNSFMRLKKGHAGLVWSRNGMDCTNAFFQKERMKTRSHGRQMSAVDYYRANMTRIVRRYKESVKSHDLFRMLAFVIHAPAQFPPALAGAIYKKFGATHVLDPFAGWGDRCVAAMAAGCKYTGIDSNTKLRGPYEKMIRFFGGGRRIRMIFRPCQKVDLAKIPYDFVFSSPPFFGKHGHLLEEYSETETDYGQFMKCCLVPVTKRLLRRGVWVCYALPPHMQRDLSKVVGKYKRVLKYNVGKRKEYVYFYHK